MPALSIANSPRPPNPPRFVKVLQGQTSSRVLAGTLSRAGLAGLVSLARSERQEPLQSWANPPSQPPVPVRGDEGVLLSPSCPSVMSCQDREDGRGALGPDEMIQQRFHFISNLTLNFNSLKDKKPRDIRCNEIKQSFSDSKFDHKWALRLLL